MDSCNPIESGNCISQSARPPESLSPAGCLGPAQAENDHGGTLNVVEVPALFPGGSPERGGGARAVPRWQP
jgi:hypothetical protein